MRVAVVGAGIAGLSAALRAYHLHDVTVFERESEAGGKIRSQFFDGFLFEWGPNGFSSSSPELQDLIRECALQDEIVPAHAAATRRYVYYGGRLHALPSNPLEALNVTLLSAGGKLRALRGLVSRAPQSNEDESVYEFFSRRFGDEIAERVVTPALLGITAGNSRVASMDALFPRLRELERRHGSLLKGLIRGRGTRGRLSTLRGGMTRLIDGLIGKAGGRVLRSCEVTQVERHRSGWHVKHTRGAGEFDAILLATPAYVAAELVRDVDAQLALYLERIHYAPMRVGGIAFRAQDVPTGLDGFGFLAARGEGVRILGALYTSTMFPEQAPAESAYLRVFLGGTADPQVLELSQSDALAVVRRDLATTLGITAAPIFYREHLWQRAIPQYALDHKALLQHIDVRLTSLPRLGVTGNAYRGVGVADSVRDAGVQINRLLDEGNE